jgi:tetratricopeptide (TPR) repeat protein
MGIRSSLFAAFLFVTAACSAQTPSNLVRLYDAAWYFSSGNPARIARLSLLRDSVNNRIANLCLPGTPVARLDAPDIDRRLQNLTKGRVLRVQDGICRVAFPVFLGPRRDSIATVAAQIAAALEDQAAQTVRALRAAGVDDRMAFHLLWSRVIDRIWDDAWELSGLPGDLPAVAWVLSPPHRYAVGTNYMQVAGGGSLALTWAPSFHEHLSPLSDAAWDLTRIAWHRALDGDSTVPALTTYGVVDAEGHSHLFAHPIAGPLDRLMDSLAVAYAAVAGRSCDWEREARRFGIDAGDLFVVLLHETAYEVFERLDRSGALTVPRVLTGGADRSEAVSLISVATGSPPSALDEAMAAYRRAGWHGTPEAVDRFRQYLDEHPDDADAYFFLGVSLFDLREWDDAIAALTRTEALTRGDTAQLRRYDWARIWIGHVYDVRGNRAAALAAYREVLGRPHDSGPQTMSQYGIAPVTAKAWARQRLDTPFRLPRR